MTLGRVQGALRQGENVVRERGEITDDGYGGHQVDWTGPPALLTVTGCAMAPLTVEEKLAAGMDAAEDAWNLYAPWADVTHLDRIRARGDLFEVTGHPSRWRSPHTGRKPGMTVRLRRITGPTPEVDRWPSA